MFGTRYKSRAPTVYVAACIGCLLAEYGFGLQHCFSLVESAKPLLSAGGMSAAVWGLGAVGLAMLGGGGSYYLSSKGSAGAKKAKNIESKDEESGTSTRSNQIALADSQDVDDEIDVSTRSSQVARAGTRFDQAATVDSQEVDHKSGASTRSNQAAPAVSQRVCEDEESDASTSSNQAFPSASHRELSDEKSGASTRSNKVAPADSKNIDVESLEAPAVNQRSDVPRGWQAPVQRASLSIPQYYAEPAIRRMQPIQHATSGVAGAPHANAWPGAPVQYAQVPFQGASIQSKGVPLQAATGSARQHPAQYSVSGGMLAGASTPMFATPPVAMRSGTVPGGVVASGGAVATSSRQLPKIMATPMQRQHTAPSAASFPTRP